MAKSLNFNNIRKKYLTITLADEKNTTLMIGMPTKAVMDELVTLQSDLETISKGDNGTEVTEELYRSCAKIMSRNKGGIQITKEYIETIFDFEDIMIFFEAYMGFISEATNEKN